MNGTAPRFYITAPSTGWMNTETTVYGMAEGDCLCFPTVLTEVVLICHRDR